jgi:assimilatory nitrate reductase catalytic subunit
VEAAPRGATVCSCFGVGEAQIVAALGGSRGSADERLAELQRSLQCGTNCGSCLPELRRLVRSSLAAA